MQAFQGDRLRGDVLDALFIFSQLALKCPFTILISGDFEPNKDNKLKIMISKTLF